MTATCVTSVWSAEEEMCSESRRMNVNFEVKVKVKCVVVQALRLCTSRTVNRGSRGIGKGKVHRCTGTEALYRPYGP